MDTKTQKQQSLVSWLRTVLSWADYENLPQTLGITKSRMSRIETSGIMYYEELRPLLSLIYTKFADSAQVREPGEFIGRFRQTHITMLELQELTEDYMKIREKQQKEANNGNNY